MPPFQEIIIAVILILGTFLMVAAAIGLLRFPDVFCRMHAAGKAGTLGISLMVLATMIFFARPGQVEMAIVIRGGLAIFFQFLTTPAATHLLARASYVTDYPRSDRTAVDELETYLPSRPDEAYGQE